MASRSAGPTKQQSHVRPEGFTVLSDCAEPVADIILIHGIQGHPKKTWLYKKGSMLGNLLTQGSDESRCYWPQDLLPLDFSNCRILVYGYDSHVSHFFSGAANTTNILGHARGFLDELEDKRRTTVGRPMLWVAHSLGGLLLKAILRQASDTDCETADGRIVHDVCESTVGTIFLGTPHRGSDYSSLGQLVANVVRVAQFDTSQNILRDLNVDAAILEILDDSFSKLYSKYGFALFTFEESRGLGIPILARGKVVPSWSAHLGYKDEQCRTINANHRAMCRFSSAESPAYGQVKRAIERCLRRRSDDPLYPEFLRALNELKTKETSLRFQQVSPAQENTYEWIFTDERLEFTSWLKSDSPLYWIKGKPASGKSTLMKFIVKDPRTATAFQSQSRAAKTSIAAFFFHDRGSYLQKSLDGLLKEILYTIVTDIPELKPLFYKVFKQHRQTIGPSTFTWHREATTQVLFEILRQDILEISLLFLLDALDEYSGKLTEISRFLLDFKGTNKTFVKICFPSRPEQVFLDTFADVKGFYIHEQTKGDIRAVIDAEFSNNVRMKHTIGENKSTDLAEIGSLKQEIADLCRGVFLWVRLVLEDILTEYTNGASLQGLRDFLDNLPTELDAYYGHIVERLDRVQPKYSDERNLMFEILRCAGATRPCTLEEFFTALQLAPALKLAGQKVVVPELGEAKRRVYSRCGALVEIQSLGYIRRRNRDTLQYGVQFLHQTAKTWCSKNRSTSSIGGQNENGDTYILKAMVHDTLHMMDRVDNDSLFDLLEYINRAEKSTECSTYWILKQAYYFQLHPVQAIPYAQRGPTEEKEYSHTLLAAMAGAPILLEDALRKSKKREESLFGDYCWSLAGVGGARYDPAVAEAVLSHISRNREATVWPGINSLMQMISALIRTYTLNPLDTLDANVVSLCEIALEQGLDLGALIHIETLRLEWGGYYYGKPFHTTFLHEVYGHSYDGGPPLDLYLKVAKVCLAHTVDVNILNGQQFTPLDVALARFNDITLFSLDSHGKDLLEIAHELCLLLVAHGGRTSGNHPKAIFTPQIVNQFSKWGFEIDSALLPAPSLALAPTSTPSGWWNMKPWGKLFSSQ